MRKRAIASSNPRRVRPKISRPCPGGFLSPLLGYSDLQLIPYAWPRFTSSRVCRREELISGRIQNEKQDAVNGTRFECWQQVATEERGLVLFFTRRIERSLQMRLVKTLWMGRSLFLLLRNQIAKFPHWFRVCCSIIPAPRIPSYPVSVLPIWRWELVCAVDWFRRHYYKTLFLYTLFGKSV